jgi:hypothetical protein
VSSFRLESKKGLEAQAVDRIRAGPIKKLCESCAERLYLARFREQSHDLPPSKQELVTDGVLSEGDVTCFNMWIPRCERFGPEPRPTERMPHWFEACTTEVKATTERDETIRIAKDGDQV